MITILLLLKPWLGHKYDKLYNIFAESANKTDEESENLHQHLLDREIDLAAFLQKYKKLRTTYHRKTLVHLAAKTSTV